MPMLLLLLLLLLLGDGVAFALHRLWHLGRLASWNYVMLYFLIGESVLLAKVE